MAIDEMHRDALDKESLKRLEKLTEEWKKKPSATGGFSVPDLRLLLDHCPQLREVIRSIALSPQGTPHASPPMQVPHSSEPQRTLDQYSSLEQKCLAVECGLTECDATVRKLEQDKKELSKGNKNLKEKCEQLEKQLKQTAEQLIACQAAQISTAPEVIQLRGDLALAQLLGLSKLPNDDTQALIQIVAILAQRDNLELLWSALKDRCEADNRPASSSECALLETALKWHNYNWRTHPYRLIDAVPSCAYHFEDHLRSRKTSTGETVVALLLPGIQDGSGKPLCKALVLTR